jgi:hypothetical protein
MSIAETSQSHRHTLMLTERDHELLVSVYKYRYLSTSQVQELHFPSAQTATRRLRMLTAAGYLSTFHALGVEERLVTLSEQGARAVAEFLLVPFDELGWSLHRQEPKDYLFLKHFLAASDFRIALTKACVVHRDLQLLGFIPEHLSEKPPKGGVQKYIRDVVSDITPPRAKIVHTPDGVFALARAGKAALFFLEIDRGTEVLSDGERGFLKTIRFYLNYLLAGGFQRYQQDFDVAEPFKAFRVLVLTSSAKRLQNMRTLCGQLAFEPAHAKRFLWLATQDAPDTATPLERSWVSLDPEDDLSYTIDLGGSSRVHHPEGRNSPQPVVDDDQPGRPTR